MRKNVKKYLRLALLLVGLFSAGMFALQFVYNAGGSETYDDALEVALQAKPSQPTQAAGSGEPAVEETFPPDTWIPAPIEDEDPFLATMEAINLDALREQNPDVIGWIFIPDSKINYPIMQGEDNDFYLNHTWLKERNSVGSIFMEHLNSPDYSDFNTLIYGHNRTDGSMFADLDKYTTQWYREKYPYIYIVTDQGVLRYELYSYYEASLDWITYGLSFHEPKTKADFLLWTLQKSQAKIRVEPRATDRILTLSTCTPTSNSTRWVVHARLKMVKADGTA